MIQNMETYCRQQNMLNRGDGIVVGVSGGVDSMALLWCLSRLAKEYQLKLYAVHIHHGIRLEAGEDENCAKAFAKELGIPFFAYHVNVPAMAKEQGKSEEEMGRELRYQHFYQVALEQGANKIAVAHHQGDQAETVLFRMARGTELAGLGGIKPVSEYRGVTVIRPLLQCTKKQLISLMEQEGISWKEDRTNGENHYARNRIRNIILPELSHINPEAESHIAEIANVMQEYDSFVQGEVLHYINDSGWVDCSKEQWTLERSRLLQQHKVIRHAVLFQALTEVCGNRKDITRAHVENLEQLLVARSGKLSHFPYAVEACVVYENLIIRKSLQKRVGTGWEQQLNISGEQEVILPDHRGRIMIEIYRKEHYEYGDWKNHLEALLNCKNNYTKCFDCATIVDKLCIRCPKTEDYFVVNSQGGRKKLSRYFIDEKMPRDDRECQLVLAHGQEVLWVIGARRGESYKITDDTNMVMVVSYEGE